MSKNLRIHLFFKVLLNLFRQQHCPRSPPVEHLQSALIGLAPPKTFQGLPGIWRPIFPTGIGEPMWIYVNTYMIYSICSLYLVALAFALYIIIELH